MNRVVALLTGLLCLSSVAPVFADTSPVPTTQPTASPAPLPIDQMRAAIYTKEFARRFALPDPAPGTEPMDGVQAIEYGMWLAKGKGLIDDIGELRTYDCELSIYFDNSLPIAWPEDARAGTSRIPATLPPLLFTWTRERFLKLSEQDRRDMDERSLRYGRLARLSTSDFDDQKRGGSLDVTWHEYDRKAFVGLAYAKLSIGCSMTGRLLDRFLKHGSSIELWLKKAGAKDYRRALAIDPNDFIRLRVPLPFVERILPWVQAGEQFNAQSITEYDGINRDQRAHRATKQIDDELARQRRAPGETTKLLDVMKRMDEAAQGRR
ncbi:MAG: hypothetical protein IPP18_16255 [Rhodocyclaceae bacterium]|nr:hypothetical protein [Rhodocyclaceae bacterium]MBK6675458.1 hypothetical protein [Rhodocyclaceae bacterium]MBK9311192.1 hypothetical protein [Rhodocyclaceae bacterium]MBK9956588.1 hypothetical protein [Rhodocyclaceae bacterium]